MHLEAPTGDSSNTTPMRTTTMLGSFADPGAYREIGAESLGVLPPLTL
jgi:hypothetical protein